MRTLAGFTRDSAGLVDRDSSIRRAPPRPSSGTRDVPPGDTQSFEFRVMHNICLASRMSGARLTTPPVPRLCPGTIFRAAAVPRVFGTGPTLRATSAPKQVWREDHEYAYGHS